MKTTLLTTTALGLALGLLSPPAFADVFVDATITKTSDTTVTQSTVKNETIDVSVQDFSNTFQGAAEADAVVNVSNSDNSVTFAHLSGNVPAFILDSTNGSSTNMLLSKTATITGSINSNNGIVGVNQDVGNMVNQANVVAFAFDDGPSSVTSSQADASQTNTNNFVYHVEAPFNANTLPNANNTSNFDYRADILGSVNFNVGAVGVNQNVGNMNNQTNTLALAVGTSSIHALGEADLGQENSGNRVIESATTKEDSIVGSVNSNQGIVQVNQSTGNMNNQASAFSVSALSSKVSISP